MEKRRRAKRKPAQDRRHLLVVLEGLLILVLLIAIFAIVNRSIASKQIADEEKASATLYQGLTAPDTAVARAASAASPQIQPEIQELMAQNGDAVGLLHFEGDRTLYVCQTDDNFYYMSHRFDRSEDPAGMIYMDYRNSLLPRSDNLILYGHNMQDGSRFGTLKRFERKNYILKYPLFQLVDRYETVDYVPFAVFHTSILPDDPAYYAFDRTDFDDAADFDRYVQEVKSRSVLEIPIDAAYGDRLLTLVTCHSDIDHGRLIIVLRELKDSDPIQR